MSRIDSAAKAPATPLIQGEQATLSDADQLCLSRWIMLKAMMFDLEDPTTSAITPAAHKWFYENRDSPAGSLPRARIWIGKFEGELKSPSYHHLAVPFAEDPSGDLDTLFTIVVWKHLLAIIAWSEQDEFSGFVFPAPLASLLVEIAPGNADVQSMPPVSTINDNHYWGFVKAFAIWTAAKAENRFNARAHLERYPSVASVPSEEKWRDFEDVDQIASIEPALVGIFFSLDSSTGFELVGTAFIVEVREGFALAFSSLDFHKRLRQVPGDEISGAPFAGFIRALIMGSKKLAKVVEISGNTDANCAVLLLKSSAFKVGEPSVAINSDRDFPVDTAVVAFEVTQDSEMARELKESRFAEPHSDDELPKIGVKVNARLGRIVAVKERLSMLRAPAYELSMPMSPASCGGPVMLIPAKGASWRAIAIGTDSSRSSHPAEFSQAEGLSLAMQLWSVLPCEIGKGADILGLIREGSIKDFGVLWLSHCVRRNGDLSSLERVNVSLPFRLPFPPSFLL